MKYQSKTKHPLLILAFFAALAFTACNEPTDLGMELLPSTDLISVKNLIEKNSISSFTHREDSVRTDEPSNSLLGSLNDPVFGVTTINFAAQFRLQEFPDFGTNPVTDSVRLYLYYQVNYGDTVTPQRFKIYELNESLYADTLASNGASYNYPYYQGIDLKSMASDNVLADYEFTPKLAIDSTSGDSLYRLLKIPLDVSLGEKLMDVDSADVASPDNFLDYFKGLFIESEKQTSVGGSILTLGAQSTGAFQGSALVVYYNNDENKNETNPDTLFMPYVITSLSARVNSINHDYTETPFYDELNAETNPDSLIYVQATGGLKARIFIDDLTLWQDSVNTAINKAEIVFQVDTLASDVKNFPPPRQLLFTVADENGNEFLPVDYGFNAAYYGGTLRSDYTYHFNITQHLQQIISGDVENHGFYLTTAYKNSQANRVVIKGSESQTGIKLVVTYSKYSN